MRSCVHCGRDFSPSRPWTKFCAERCRRAHHAERYDRAGRNETALRKIHETLNRLAWLKLAESGENDEQN